MSAIIESSKFKHTAFITVFGLLVACGVHAQPGPTEYSAEYAAAYKGRNVGTSRFSLSRDPATGRYVYISDTRAKGLLRMAAPNPAIDRSEFTLREGRIVPLTFRHEDGSRKGDDNHTIEFDWDRHEAQILGANGSHSVALEDGMLDRGSLQVALMYDLSRGLEPSSYTTVDDDSTTTYEFTFEGRKTVDSELGPIEVLTYVQQREDSSRRTIIELAPALGYVPVRIEQFRDGESRSAFVIQSLDRD